MCNNMVLEIFHVTLEGIDICLTLLYMYTAYSLTAIRPLGKFSHKCIISWSFQTWQQISTSIRYLIAASMEQHRQFR